MELVWKILQEKYRTPCEKWMRNMRRTIRFMWRRSKIVLIVLILGAGHGGWTLHSYMNDFYSTIAEINTRDPDGLYQLAEKICTVENAQPNLSNSRIVFDKFNCIRNIDLKTTVEYRDFVIKCEEKGQPSIQMGAITQSIMRKPVCQIIGKRD